jgi:hypothetical protein
MYQQDGQKTLNGNWMPEWESRAETRKHQVSRNATEVSFYFARVLRNVDAEGAGGDDLAITTFGFEGLGPRCSPPKCRALLPAPLAVVGHYRVANTRSQVFDLKHSTLSRVNAAESRCTVGCKENSQCVSHEIFKNDTIRSLEQVRIIVLR